MVFARCIRNSSELPVYDNLSISPSQMMTLAHEGTPISAQSLGMVFDVGYSDNDFSVPLEHQRGVDLSDMWDARLSFRKRVSDAKKAGLFQPVNVNE